MKRFCLVLCGLGLFSGLVPSSSGRAALPISLQARTAGDLAALCAADPTSAGADAKINFCHGFAQGAVDVRLRMSADKKPFCFPNPAPSRASTMREFVSWVRATPANRDMTVLDGLFKFLDERYPCKQ
jgi:Rap1a immunity proteins